ncbi:MAG TPA: hypothetical protein PLS50_07685 [Candidatus Dojkabacteria bacterium]|nr:hypothetical protein [Candidatus Dojkabacteria bacterium]
MPKIHKTQTGKQYIIVNGKKVFLLPGMTKKEILSVYLLLKKTIPVKKRKKRSVPTNVARAVVNIRPETVLPDRSVSVASSGANERDQLESAINKVNKIIEKEQAIPQNQRLVHVPNQNNRFKRSRTNLLAIGNPMRNPLPIAHNPEHKMKQEKNVLRMIFVKEKKLLKEKKMQDRKKINMQDLVQRLHNLKALLA